MERKRRRFGEAARYVRIMRDRPADSAYVMVRTVIPAASAKTWYAKGRSRFTEIHYGRFNIDFVLHQDVSG